MHRCFVDKLWIDEWLLDPKKEVPKEVNNRFFKVLRIKKDEKVALFDGQGRELSGFLSADGTLEASLKKERPETISVVLFQAALEEAKISETLKRTTEFGIQNIIIFKAEYSDAFCLGKLEKRHERLTSLVIDAARQSGRLFVPEICFEADLKAALKCASSQAIGFFGDLSAEKKLSHVLASTVLEHDIALAVGPEGGFSEKEKELLKAHNFCSVLWAPYTLRSELASLSPLAILNAFLGRA